MNKTLYSIINPAVKSILRSPLHSLMSHNTVVVEFKGRKSGKTFSTPVSYHDADGVIHCFTDKSNTWWHNLRNGNEVRLTLRGRECVGKPTVLDNGSSAVRSALTEFLVATPRDASHAEVAFDANRKPVASDVVEASKRLVLIAIKLQD